MTMKSSTFPKQLPKAVTSVSSKLLALDVQQGSVLAVVVKNTGANPLTGFRMEAKISRYNNTPGISEEGQDDEYFTLKSGSFTSTDFFVLSCSSELSTLAAGASALMLVNATMLDFVRFWGTSTLGTTLQFHVSEWQSE